MNRNSWITLSNNKFSNNVNTDKSRYFLFKQKLPILIYLSIIQTWLNFNFPAFIRLGSQCDIPMKVMISIAVMLIYLTILIFPEHYSSLINLAFLDDFPNPHLFKHIFRGLMLLAFHALYLYFWYIDYHQVSNTWYVILYAHYIIKFILIYQLICKAACKSNTEPTR